MGFARKIVETRTRVGIVIICAAMVLSWLLMPVLVVWYFATEGGVNDAHVRVA